ncbi:MAG: hypothetical protein H0U20_04480 [Thermoleophilaceae bacterium]|nr:hypothetical protein [Thermoleophilaceae bacterium]
MLRDALLALPVAAAMAFAGCGNQVEPVGSLTPTPSKETRSLEYPRVGLTLSLPADLEVAKVGPPGVFRAGVGPGFVSAFAYRRKEQLPRSDAQLEAARRRLVDAAEERGDGYDSISSSTTEIGGSKAVELVGDQTISRARLRTRSLHVYEGRAEYVIELAVPIKDFDRLDRAVLAPVEASLEVTGEVREEGG